MNDIQYKYAYINYPDKPKVIYIDDVSLALRNDNTFICPECKSHLTAVLGDIRAHHFRHKKGIQCSYESYLHKLAKAFFRERFERNEVVMITNHHNSFNLKEWYSDISVEKKYKNFRPDVLLEDSNKEKKTLMVEFTTAHPIEKKKKLSGEFIFEIKIQSEKDLEDLRVKEIIEGEFYNIPFQEDIRVNATSDKEWSNSIVNDDNSKQSNEVIWPSYNFSKEKKYNENAIINNKSKRNDEEIWDSHSSSKEKEHIVDVSFPFLEDGADGRMLLGTVLDVVAASFRKAGIHIKTYNGDLLCLEKIFTKSQREKIEGKEYLLLKNERGETLIISPCYNPSFPIIPQKPCIVIRIDKENKWKQVFNSYLEITEGKNGEFYGLKNLFINYKNDI